MAASFPQDFIETVRNAGDIAQLVSDYVPLKAAGTRMKGLCPFHEEKTPSFSVDPTRQLFYCFGCQSGGDIFKFVQLYEQLPFPEAVEFLASRWSIPLPERSSGAVQEGPAERLRRMNDAALAFFKKTLADERQGKSCRDYIARRGIGDDLATRLGLGFAPDSWDALNTHLTNARYRPEELRIGGLALPRQSGSGQYDRFRQRLMFPIRDIQGRVVAFGGRAIGDGEPKYINSPETPAYTKGHHLYGLDLAREAIRKAGHAIIVEGYLDLAALLQAGIEPVVASLGTAFTPQQARLLARYTERVVFSYDGDGAGAKATERSLDLLLNRGFDVRIVDLPQGEDPDDAIRNHGADAYRKLVDEAPPYLEFLIRREMRRRDLNRIDEKVAAVNAVLPHVAKLESAIERSEWVARMADALRVDSELVMQELRGAVREARPQIRQRPAEPVKAPLEAELRLVAVLLQSEDERQPWASGDLELTELDGTRVQPIVRAIVELARKRAQVDYPAVLEALDSDRDRDLLTQIAFRDEPEQGPNVQDCLSAFRRRNLTREGRQLRKQIGDRQQAGPADFPPADVDRQLARLQELARQREALH